MTVNTMLVVMTGLAFLLGFVILGFVLRSLAVETGKVIEKRYKEPTIKVVPNYGEMGYTGMPTTYEAPGKWILLIEDDAGNQGEVVVSQQDWETYQRGDFYPRDHQ